MDNYATDKHPKVGAWLAQRPRIHVHHTPTCASWLSQAERWFGLITQRAIQRGTLFRVVAAGFRAAVGEELIARIEKLVAA